MSFATIRFDPAEPVDPARPAAPAAAPDRAPSSRTRPVTRDDVACAPATPELIDRVGIGTCLAHDVLPWRGAGAVTLVAAASPERFSDLRAELENRLGPVRMVPATRDAVRAGLLAARGAGMAGAAETAVPLEESCRRPAPPGRTALLGGLAALVLAGTLAAPRLAVAVLAGWALLFLVINTALKLAALFAVLRARRTGSAPEIAPENVIAPRPRVSIMVPLFRERAIAARLIARLEKLAYPKELLDVCLVVEEDDAVTREALSTLILPSWMQVVIVPPGGLKTKPRALNYALAFCRGSIIGVYDAEDAPAPDQIDRVAAAFAASPREVACLQGVLDFYNTRRNWLSRCFTVEYASWFRVILPGFAQLGLVLPLGGTTFFIRRDVLEEVGAWDAWNVTEDADLGLRLARRGYRTELIDTVTEEEANSRAWPWVKQRSRWLKGYAMTWGVHMRRPRRLLRDLGPWRFFGVQAIFLGTLSQFALAPLLLSFWLLGLGLPHPLGDTLSAPALTALWAVFVFAEGVTMLIGAIAVARKGQRRLLPWVPTLHAYYPLATLAVFKGLSEIVHSPFYWDKTEHGAFHAGPEA